MADVYTTSASVNYVATAYDRLAYPALRPELYYDALADVKPTQQSMPGLTVQFQLQYDLAPASTALNESTDVSAVALSDTDAQVTLSEYGSAVISTAALRAGSFVDIDEIVANVVGYNAGVSIDSVARSVLEGNSQVAYSAGTTGVTPTSKGTVTTADTFRAYDVLVAQKLMRVQNVPTVNGKYWSIIHPEVSFDFQADTGLDGWLYPQVYGVDQSRLYNGEIGEFGGVRFIETPRAPQYSNQGSSSSDGVYNVYGTFFGGVQSFAKAWSSVDGNGPDPHIVPGPVTDHLRRFVPIGWYHLVGYGFLRQAALLQQFSSSSIQAVLATAAYGGIPSINTN
jgi:N4-gp56 family major capsid protein